MIISKKDKFIDSWK